MVLLQAYDFVASHSTAEATSFQALSAALRCADSRARATWKKLSLLMIIFFGVFGGVQEGQVTNRTRVPNWDSLVRVLQPLEELFDELTC